MDKEVQTFWDSLPDEHKKFIEDVMMATMDMCNCVLSTHDNPPILMFDDEQKYNIFRNEMLNHMFKGEYYNPYKKEWQPIQK